METKVERQGFVDKLFCRKPRSPETTEKSKKTIDEIAAGVKSEIEKLTKLCNKEISVNAVEKSDKKPNDSGESSKNDEALKENTKVEEKLKGCNSRKKFLLNDDVGQVKLTEIINNSIKEAVLNIVKEGVCPLADDLEIRGKDSHKLEETQNQENKPKTPKNHSSLQASTIKTFDSHFCQNQFEASTQHEPVLASRSPRKSFREASPRRTKEKKVSKSAKQKDGKRKDPSSSKIVRQPKTSHFRTDNRRMTGNVNIYICSEANDTTNDSKMKPENEGPSVQELETDSQTKRNGSDLSISTSKLMAALKRRKLKNASDQSLNCICETPESSYEAQCCDNSDDDQENDLLCICDENDEPASANSFTSSSRNASIDDNDKFSEQDFPKSINGRYSDWESRPCTNYDRNQFWSSTRVECPSYARKGVDSNDSCSCSTSKCCQPDRNSENFDQQHCNIRSSQSYHQESGDNRCLCVIEEKEEDCCTDKQAAGEKLTVCCNQSPICEPNSQDDKKPVENESAEGTAKETTLTEGNKVKKSTKNKANIKSGTIDSNVQQVSPVEPEKNQRTSFFRRSMNRAMTIVKNMTSENANEVVEKKKELVPAKEAKPKKNDNEAASVGKKKDGSGSTIDHQPLGPTGTPTIPRIDSNESRSKSRISVALANRKNSATKNSSRLDKDQSSCKKSSETRVCCCEKSRPVNENNCKCCLPAIQEVETTIVCCKKMKPQTHVNCDENDRSKEKSICAEKLEAEDLKTCKCCPGCKRTLTECKCPGCKKTSTECNCRSNKRTKPEEDSCKRCCSPEQKTCCVSKELRTSNKTNHTKCCKPAKVQGHPKNHGHQNCSRNEPKSMICIYCDNPRENCICNVPIRKCSQCCMPLDVCTCKPTSCCDCNGRQILPAEDNKKQTICVTAWKPRQNVARYFSRSPETVDDVTYENCSCWENSKPYSSGELAYQKTGVFSDVLDELQQKISGSVCCKICKKFQCRCHCDVEEKPEKIVMTPCLSTIPEHESRGERSRKRSRSQSPLENTCKCPPTRRRSTKKSGPMKICDRCQTSPCRCRRDRQSPENKPVAQCCYCKSSPCTCESVNETGNSRPLRNGDSSSRRRKDRACKEKINENIDNEDNEYYAPETDRFVPCPGKQQRNRKYCYRASPNGSRRKPSYPGERLR